MSGKLLGALVLKREFDLHATGNTMPSIDRLSSKALLSCVRGPQSSVEQSTHLPLGRSLSIQCEATTFYPLKLTVLPLRN